MRARRSEGSADDSYESRKSSVRGEAAKTRARRREDARGDGSGSGCRVMRESLFTADADTESESRYVRFLPCVSLSLSLSAPEVRLSR